MNFKSCYHDSTTNSCTCKNININNSIWTAASNRDFQSLKNIISKDKRKALTLTPILLQPVIMSKLLLLLTHRY